MSKNSEKNSKQPLLEARGITKKFGAITALEDVNMKLYPNEVLGVVGDNGAGKSTLMKILSGLYKQSSGELFFEGNKINLESPRNAQDIGIEMVYQDLALAGNLSIHENIYLGREPGLKFFGMKIVDSVLSRKMAAEHLKKLHIENLSGGQAQAVAIARATAFNSRVVVMDEPTAALAIKEVGKVLDLIKNLKQQGVSVILISHRLDDVFYVCDRVMSLFHGKNFEEAPLAKTNRNEVIGWLMGTKGHTKSLAHDRID